MIKKLRRVGKSHALILGKPIMKALGLEAGGHVRLAIMDGALIVTPVSPCRVSDETVHGKLAVVIEKRKRVLARLAKSGEPANAPSPRVDTNSPDSSVAITARKLVPLAQVDYRQRLRVSRP